MKEKEKLELIKKQINEKKDILYSSSLNDAYRNYLSVAMLNNFYKTITGENVFDNDKFDLERKELSEKSDLDATEMFTSITDNFNTNISLIKERDILRMPFKCMGNYTRENYDKIVSSFFNLKLSKAEIDKIMMAFLGSIKPEYKNLYEKMNEEGRILLPESRLHGVGGLTYHDYNFDNKDNFYVTVTNVGNDFLKLSFLAHEFGHVIEQYELLKNATHEEIMKFEPSVFTETTSMLFAKRYFDFLDSIDLKDIGTMCRNEEILKNTGYMANLVNSINSGKEVDFSHNSNLKYILGDLLTSYFTTIDDKEKARTILQTFDKSKLTERDIRILDNLDCDNKTLVKSVERNIKKCL